MVGLGQEGVAGERGKYLKDLKSGWNRKEGRGSKDCKKMVAGWIKGGWGCFKNVGLETPSNYGFRVQSRSFIKFKIELSVTTVNSSLQLLLIFLQKEHHLRCCIGLELNIVI